MADEAKARADIEIRNAENKMSAMDKTKKNYLKAEEINARFSIKAAELSFRKIAMKNKNFNFSNVSGVSAYNPQNTVNEADISALSNSDISFGTSQNNTKVDSNTALLDMYTPAMLRGNPELQNKLDATIDVLGSIADMQSEGGAFVENFDPSLIHTVEVFKDSDGNYKLTKRGNVLSLVKSYTGSKGTAERKLSARGFYVLKDRLLKNREKSMAVEYTDQGKQKGLDDAWEQTVKKRKLNVLTKVDKRGDLVVEDSEDVQKVVERVEAVKEALQ